MNKTLVYRFSLGFTILLALCSFVTLLGWVGTLINNIGRLPALELLPWTTLGLLALTAINCTVRAHFLVYRSPIQDAG
jgi:hypothetical protein